MSHDRHLTDREIVEAIDRELPPSREPAVEQHLSRCWRCRARRAKIEQTMSQFVHLQESVSPVPLPPEGPLARLRAQLGRERGERSARWRPSMALAGFATMACAAAVFLLTTERSVQARSLPDVRHTPGAASPIAREQLCAAANPDDRPVPAALANEVFRLYGIEPRPRAYEVDYLIAPSLGGAEDIRNLWPQPYFGGPWTARVKDALEDYLRGEVCAGRIDLATAQREIAGDWIASYRRHFRASRPLPEHAGFVKDRPWE